MATRRHRRGAFLVLLAALLILPPLTSAIADGLGIELSHHHCDSHDDTGLSTAATDHDAYDHHGAAEHDPFQCDQCHIALAALNGDPAVATQPLKVLPTPAGVPVLSARRPPPAFKPPIA